MLWGEIEETVSWVVASGLGVSGGEAMGTEKTQGSHLCSENAVPPPPHAPRQKMTVVAQVQGGGFCKWSMPKPPPFKEVDLSMGGGGGGVARMRPVEGAVHWLHEAGLGRGRKKAGGGVPAVLRARPSGHQGGSRESAHTLLPPPPPGNHLSECLFHRPPSAVFLPVLPWLRAGLMNGAQFRVGGRSAAGARA